jgi:hypothetical protein
MLPPATLEILKRLDKEDLKKFGLFLKSPYFNTMEILPKVFEIIKNTYPEFNSPALSFQNMFAKLYKGKEFKEQTIRNLYSEIGNLLKSFIAVETLKTDEIATNTAFLLGLRQKKAFELSNKTAEKNRDKIINNFGIGALAFHSHYINYANWTNNMNDQRKNTSKEYISLVKSLSENLIVFLLKEIFLLASENISYRKLFIDAKEDLVFEKFINAFNINDFLDEFDKINISLASILKIQYWFYYYSVNELSETEFYKIKNEITKNISRFYKVEQVQFIQELIRLALTKLVPADKKYYKDIFDLMKLFCSLDIYPDNNIADFKAGTFRDMFTVAVILKEFSWAENFVNQYSKFLGEDVRSNEFNYCMGNLSFKQGKYERSLDYFNRVELKDVIEKINIRFFYLMNFIELGAFENARSALQTLRQYSQDRKNIPEMYSILIPDALKYFQEIIKCKEQNKKIEEYLFHEAFKEKRYYHKQYIQEKMNELI